MGSIDLYICPTAVFGCLVELNNSFQSVNSPPPTKRPEMKGPKNSDIDNILAGLKSKTVDIHENENKKISNNDSDSVISISSLKSLEDATGPKSSKRKKNKSDKNIISLDI